MNNIRSIYILAISLIKMMKAAKISENRVDADGKPPSGSLRDRDNRFYQLLGGGARLKYVLHY